MATPLAVRSGLTQVENELETLLVSKKVPPVRAEAILLTAGDPVFGTRTGSLLIVLVYQPSRIWGLHYFMSTPADCLPVSSPFFFDSSANDKEDGRNGYNSVLSARALHEIYLMPFMLAQKHARPWSFMIAWLEVCMLSIIQSTNLSTAIIVSTARVFMSVKIRFFLKTILRDEWKFDGPVRSLPFTLLRSLLTYLSLCRSWAIGECFFLGILTCHRHAF
jgi:hypothetical protein